MAIMKHKVFFWLIMKDRLNSRVLKRKAMQLDDYTCEMCIWQREETIYRLFLSCNFARACWDSIDLFGPITTNPEIAVQRF
jgi:hypothetical protein